MVLYENGPNGRIANRACQYYHDQYRILINQKFNLGYCDLLRMGAMRSDFSDVGS